jgi:integrase
VAVIKISHVDGRDVAGWRTQYRYAVYEHKLVLDVTNAYTRSFIVVKNQYDVIVHFTCFHNYIDAYAKGVCVPLASDAKTKMHYVCSMLNFILIENFETIGVEHVFGVEKEMLDVFFQDYAFTKRPDGSYRSRQTVEKCVSAVIGFFRKLCRSFEGYMKISSKDLYDEKTVLTKRGRLHKKLVPNFKVRTVASEKIIFRDIPAKVFQVIVNQAFRYKPEIVFAICLQAFAGLRPGEVCNMRQECSPLGRGLTFTVVDGVVKTVEIDLSVEYVLRSDGVRCGGIKKERRQRVYPAFLPAFCKAYEFHKHSLRGGFEQDYCPMFVGSWGMAMTYFDYRRKFQHLITEHVRPTLLNNDDPECRLFGQLLYEHKLGPHALRHWYSVQLVLMGEDIAGLQYWRGDSSPESAIGYLQNKGDLIKELSVANDMLADFLTSEGGRLYGGH